MGKARDAKRKSDLKKISIALEDYLNDHRCYPDEVTCDPGTGLVPYLNKIPCDPKTKESYYYERPDDCSKFGLYTDLEAEDGVNCNDYDYVVTSPNYVIEYPCATPTLPPGPTSIPATPTPTAFFSGYSCFSGVCQPIPLGWICEPTYQDEETCAVQCNNNPSGNECVRQ